MSDAVAKTAVIAGPTYPPPPTSSGGGTSAPSTPAPATPRTGAGEDAGDEGEASPSDEVSETGPNGRKKRSREETAERAERRAKKADNLRRIAEAKRRTAEANEKAAIDGAAEAQARLRTAQAMAEAKKAEDQLSALQFQSAAAAGDAKKPVATAAASGGGGVDHAAHITHMLGSALPPQFKCSAEQYVSIRAEVAGMKSLVMSEWPVPSERIRCDKLLTAFESTINSQQLVEWYVELCTTLIKNGIGADALRTQPSDRPLAALAKKVQLHTVFGLANSISDHIALRREQLALEKSIRSDVKVLVDPAQGESRPSSHPEATARRFRNRGRGGGRGAHNGGGGGGGGPSAIQRMISNTVAAAVAGMQHTPAYALHAQPQFGARASFQPTGYQRGGRGGGGSFRGGKPKAPATAAAAAGGL